LNPLTDNALMLQVKEGQVNKMGLLFERYHRPLYGFFYHLNGQPSLSEDLVQTVFYRMLKYRHTFSGEGEFRTWMYHLARNVVVDEAKKNKTAKHHDDISDWQERLGGGTTADGELHKTQDVALLHQALDRLPQEQREVLVLSRFQDMKYGQIAQVLDTTEGAVKVRVHRALGHLRDIYMKLSNGN